MLVVGDRHRFIFSVCSIVVSFQAIVSANQASFFNGSDDDHKTVSENVNDHQVVSSNHLHCENHKNQEKLAVLKQVILIHRHGDRNPLEYYPTDPYKDSKFWPEGSGNLNLAGKRRMYELGLYLRQRYQSFLTYHSNEAYVRSSGKNRCLESVSLLLAGLYPPVDKQKWNDGLGQLWQPVSIQTVPYQNDGLLNPTSRCQKAQKQIDDIYNSVEAQNHWNQIEPIMEQVKQHSGHKKMDLSQVFFLTDTLMCERQAGLELPSWVTDQIYQTLVDTFNKLFLWYSASETIHRLRAGLLLNEIIEKIQESEKRLLIYSTHDTTLTAVLGALKAFNGLMPPYGSAIILEVWQSTSIKKSLPSINLKLFFLNSTTGTGLNRLSMPDECSSSNLNYWNNENNDKIELENDSVCTFELFKSFVGKISLKTQHQWNEECDMM